MPNVTLHDAAQVPVLITGGTGFVGSHLLETLYQAGYRQLHTTSFSGTTDEYVGQFAQIHKIDLTNAAATRELFHQVQPTQIYHLASFSVTSDGFAQAGNLLQNNLNVQLNVLEALRQETPHARLLSIGSAEEYGVLPKHWAGQPVKEDTPLYPANPYAVSKASQEMLSLAYAHNFGLQIICARPFNHIGERQTDKFVVPSFAHQIARIEQGLQKNIQIGNLAAVKDFSDVKDVVQAYLLLMAHGQPADVYNVGSGTGITIQKLLELMVELSSAQVEVEVDQARWRPVLSQPVIPDITKITALGWQPQHTLTSTLARVLNDWRTRV